VIGEYPLSAKEDVDKAVAGSHAAFKSWSRMPVNEREKCLDKFIMLLDANKQKIGEMLTREEGKTLKEALGEPSRGVIECKYILGEGQRMEGVTMPSDRTGVVSVANRVPLGVVAAISPWNFPFLTPLRKMFPALAAGNTVVFKPASDTPHCGVMIMELFEQAGLHERLLDYGGNLLARRAYEHPVVDPQVSHFRQVPLRTRVECPQAGQGSPS
jgi:aldehyde dehydrogenase (NAD+)